MAGVRITIKGRAGGISMATFLTVMQNSFQVLRELDAIMSTSPRGSLDWTVKDLVTGSLVVELESRSKLEDKNFGPPVTDAFLAGFHQIEQEVATPPYMTSPTLRRMEKVVGVIGKDGATGLAMSPIDALFPAETEITTQATINMRELLRVRYRAVASVEGKLLTISLTRQPHFVVYDEHTRKAVVCRFDSGEWLARVKDALGYRVNVAGLLSSNVEGEPLSIKVDGLRILRTREQLPTVADLAGSDPDFTGNLSTGDYIRSIRLG